MTEYTFECAICKNKFDWIIFYGDMFGCFMMGKGLNVIFGMDFNVIFVRTCFDSPWEKKLFDVLFCKNKFDWMIFYESMFVYFIREETFECNICGKPFWCNYSL